MAWILPNHLNKVNHFLHKTHIGYKIIFFCRLIKSKQSLNLITEIDFVNTSIKFLVLNSFVTISSQPSLTRGLMFNLSLLQCYWTYETLIWSKTVSSHPNKIGVPYFTSTWTSKCKSSSSSIYLLGYNKANSPKVTLLCCFPRAQCLQNLVFSPQNKPCLLNSI